MSKKTILGAAVAGATALAVFGLAGAAQAASETIYTRYSDGLMAYTDAVSSDQFLVKDISADGYGVRGEIRSAGGTLLSWNYVGGNGKIRTWSYDLAKSKNYIMRVCLGEGSGDTTLINCVSKEIRDDT
ncbi:hypothetical protein RB614_42025 [Phytohabitans sp. ZYX-F-186]|uniref:Ricin B lectin domain-containing protein n=1 Tax=Phytohabitans maris TaxID=3071409 RepID=A0ABU0ZX56_9ACTN|nr:hypothetical protein [Phytohabitans sp. ZYX-F-186]MDQ7911087.1 hypothetical protein [Phytohabitans sp. ZYX-F-186]